VTEKKHEKAKREHREAKREHEKATREHERAEEEHMNEMSFSAEAKRRHLSQSAVTCWPRFETIYIYILYTFRT
jgi:hypothetical protein